MNRFRFDFYFDLSGSDKVHAVAGPPAPDDDRVCRQIEMSQQARQLDDGRGVKISQERDARYQFPIANEIAATVLSRKARGENTGPEPEQTEPANHHESGDHTPRECLRHSVAISGRGQRRHCPPQRLRQAAEVVRLARALEDIEGHGRQRQPDQEKNENAGTRPRFLMMGSFAATAGMATDLYNLAHAVLGRLRGGLAYATVLGCAGFGALTSSSIATASLIGKVAVPEMRERGYSPALATGVCAAGGTLGALVPPSGPLIVFALLTEASVGQLFMGAFGPALLSVLLYCATVWLYSHLAPKSCPPSVRSGAEEIGQQLRKCLAVGLLLFKVMGGLYLGVFTDT